MGKLDKIEEEWEQLFMQYKNSTGDSVICMVNKTSRKRLYFDVKLNRFLSKREASKYTIDFTGQFLIQS
jgi:predicted transport protein